MINEKIDGIVWTEEKRNALFSLYEGASILFDIFEDAERVTGYSYNEYSCMEGMIYTYFKTRCFKDFNTSSIENESLIRFISINNGKIVLDKLGERIFNLRTSTTAVLEESVDASIIREIDDEIHKYSEDYILIDVFNNGYIKVGLAVSIELNSYLIYKGTSKTYEISDYCVERR